MSEKTEHSKTDEYGKTRMLRINVDQFSFIQQKREVTHSIYIYSSIVKAT